MKSGGGWSVVIGLVLLLAGPAVATEAADREAEIIGVASVIDGDTLEIHDRRIRLDGIDAPESAQLCLRQGQKERCGQKSAFFLADLIGRATVRCVAHDVDRYGRDIATCWLGEVNLNEKMVAAGQAMAYRKYSKRYVEAERAAEAAGLGLWSTRFEMPWDYRRRINKGAATMLRGREGMLESCPGLGRRRCGSSWLW